MDSKTLLELLEESPLLPIISVKDAALGLRLAEVFLQAGFPAIELTHRSAGAMDTFKAVLEWNAGQQDPLVLGAGSIMDGALARAYAEIGAAFLVGPGFVPEVAQVCQRAKLAYLAGCMTPTEISVARAAGVEITKLFPASSLGAGHLKAIRGPLPWLKALATGGIPPLETEMKAWFEAGASAIGMGSELMPKAEMEAGNWKAIGERAGKALVLARKLKQAGGN